MHEETERPVSTVFSLCQLFTVDPLRTIWQCYFVPARLNTSFLNYSHEVVGSYRRFLENLSEKVTLPHVSLRTFIDPVNIDSA